MESKYVIDYHVTQHAHGTYWLTFNTKERWIPYHRYNDESYGFGRDEEGKEGVG